MKDKVPGWMREFIKTMKDSKVPAAMLILEMRQHGEDPYNEELRARRLSQLLDGIRNS